MSVSMTAFEFGSGSRSIGSADDFAVAVLLTPDCADPPKKAVICRCSGDKVLCFAAASMLLLAPLFRLPALACKCQSHELTYA